MSIIGYMFSFCNCIISWNATLQDVVALLITKAKHVVATYAIKVVLWLEGLAGELGLSQNYVVMHYDNHSTIHLSNHKKTKRVDVKLHLIKDQITMGCVDDLMNIHIDDKILLIY